MKITQLSAEEHRALGFTHKVVVDWNDLVGTAGLTKAQNIYPGSGNARIGTCINKVAARVVTAFVGCTALVVEIGYGTDPNAILASSNMMATAGTWYGITPATCPIAFSAPPTRSTRCSPPPRTTSARSLPARLKSIST
jgi:hypothetical protein